MAKGDFTVDDDYSNNYDSFNTNSNMNNYNNYNNSSNAYGMNYGSNSDFSNYGMNNNNNGYFNGSDVLFEDESDDSNQKKSSFKVKTFNKNVLLLFIIIGLVFFAAIVVVIVIVANINASYKATVTIPDIIYMDELEAVSVVAEGKKDVSKAVTEFESANPDIISFVDDKLEGKNISNLMIPVQEGTTKISVKSTFGKRILAEESKDVTVCRNFGPSLIPNGAVSVNVDHEVDLKLNSSEDICSEGITYESANKNVVSVTTEGVVKGLKEGTTTLKVSKGDRNFTVPVYVTKSSVTANTISVDKTTLQLVPKETKRLKVSFSPKNTYTNFPIFDSHNTSIARVDDYGFVTAEGEGETEIVIASGYIDEKVTVKVIVSNLVSEQGSLATGLSLGLDNLTLDQGQSYTINSVITPSNTKDKTIEYTSSNSDVAGVNEYGVIYAKSGGTAIIEAKTSNGIRKAINVSVIGLASPILKATDGVGTNLWHRKAYTLRFSGAPVGSIYYYGKNENNLKKGTEINIKKDGTETFYIKTCRNYSCSSIATYVSKLDSIKPKVLKVVQANNNARIAMSDDNSMIDSCCVVSTDNVDNCKWKKLTPKLNHVVSTSVTVGSTYYIFAKDVAGNISDSYEYIVK